MHLSLHCDLNHGTIEGKKKKIRKCQERMKEDKAVAEAAEQGQGKVRGVTTTLDELPFGSENYYEEDRQKTRAERRRLPDGTHGSVV